MNLHHLVLYEFLLQGLVYGYHYNINTKKYAEIIVTNYFN